MVSSRGVVLALAGVSVLFAVLVAATARRTDVEQQTVAGTSVTLSTSRADLQTTVALMENRLAANAGDAAAAVSLADALLRQTRVTGNAGLAMRAEAALRKVLDQDPADYDSRRMLATVLLSQHRFREAIVEADKARAARPDDAWNFGALGDAHLELGEYDEAYAAFDRMMQLRPSAASYARASYARELTGDLPGALRLMQMAAEATGPQDPESQAWHEAQMGHLTFELGRLDEARRHFERAEFLFPGHPFAADGLSKVAESQGDAEKALDIAQRQFKRTPSPDLAARIGDLLTSRGLAPEAERYYGMAESLWRFDMPEPAALARFLATHDRKISEAVTQATQAAAGRKDIFTEDALAWALFKSGRIEDALAAARRALRTGTRDRQILAHAAAIHEAAGVRLQ